MIAWRTQPDRLVLTGKTIMLDASFAPWNSLCVHLHQEMYQSLCSSFDSYYLEEVPEWRWRTGFDIYTSSFFSEVPSSTWVIGRCWCSNGVNWGCFSRCFDQFCFASSAVFALVSPSLSLTPSRPSDVTCILREKKAVQSSRSPIVSSKAGSPGSRKSGSHA